jgi:two-component system LytT family sensor kinase
MALYIFRSLVLILIAGAGWHLLMNVEYPVPKLVRFVTVGVLFATVSSIQGAIQLLLPALLNRLPERLTPQQLVAQVVFASGFTAAFLGGAIMFGVEKSRKVDFDAKDYFLNIGLLVIITAGVTAVYALRTFVERWRSARDLEQELKQAVLKAEFESLKNQVNPHFLFNSLNILSALIPENPAQSVELVERLSRVFRYNLQNADRATVELGTELKIVEAYLFIHQTRFGTSLRYDIRVPPEAARRQVVTQGALTLVENALKHNECSRERPLWVHLDATEHGLIVTNPIQRKNRLPGDSTGIGLSNLRSRYALLTEQAVEVTEEAGEFIVKLPLL